MKVPSHKKPVKKAEPPAAPALHATVDGFMTGLKALPKAGPDRGKFITSHMGHAPFIAAVQAHPQGQQVMGLLNHHLNSVKNAGFKPGQTQATAKFEKMYGEEVEKPVTMDPRHPDYKTKVTTPKPPPQPVKKGDVIKFPGNPAPKVDQGKEAPVSGFIEDPGYYIKDMSHHLAQSHRAQGYKLKVEKGPGGARANLYDSTGRNTGALTVSTGHGPPSWVGTTLDPKVEWARMPMISAVHAVHKWPAPLNYVHPDTKKR